MLVVKLGVHTCTWCSMRLSSWSTLRASATSAECDGESLCLASKKGMSTVLVGGLLGAGSCCGHKCYRKTAASRAKLGDLRLHVDQLEPGHASVDGLSVGLLQLLRIRLLVRVLRLLVSVLRLLVSVLRLLVSVLRLQHGLRESKRRLLPRYNASEHILSNARAHGLAGLQLLALRGC
jgi:hypothetical protein